MILRYNNDMQKGEKGGGYAARLFPARMHAQPGQVRVLKRAEGEQPRAKTETVRCTENLKLTLLLEERGRIDEHQAFISLLRDPKLSEIIIVDSKSTSTFTSSGAHRICIPPTQNSVQAPFSSASSSKLMAAVKMHVRRILTSCFRLTCSYGRMSQIQRSIFQFKD